MMRDTTPQKVSLGKQVPVEPEQKSSHTQRRQSLEARDSFRTLAACYLGYLVYQLISEMSAGTVSDRAILWVIAATALLCIGAVRLIWPEVKHIKEVLDTDEPL